MTHIIAFDTIYDGGGFDLGCPGCHGRKVYNTSDTFIKYCKYCKEFFEQYTMVCFDED